MAYTYFSPAALDSSLISTTSFFSSFSSFFPSVRKEKNVIAEDFPGDCSLPSHKQLAEHLYVSKSNAKPTLQHFSEPAYLCLHPSCHQFLSFVSSFCDLFCLFFHHPHLHCQRTPPHMQSSCLPAELKHYSKVISSASKHANKKQMFTDKQSGGNHN